MATNDNGPKRVNWQTLIGTFGAVGTLLLGAYTFFEGQEKDRVIIERNERQAAICVSVNRLGDAVAVLVRDATGITGARNPEQAARAAAYKESALEEIRRARCTVSDVTGDRNPLGLDRLGGKP